MLGVDSGKSAVDDELIAKKLSIISVHVLKNVFGNRGVFFVQDLRQTSEQTFGSNCLLYRIYSTQNLLKANNWHIGIIF